MIRLKQQLEESVREEIRGGLGKARLVEYLSSGDMIGEVTFLSTVKLEPGSTIGDHPHPDAEEFYLILEGKGVGVLDGETFEVEPGDGYLCRAGHAHSLRNTGEEPLTFLALLTREKS